MTVADIKKYINNIIKNEYDKRANELMMTRTYKEKIINDAKKILRDTSFKPKRKSEIIKSKKDIENALDKAFECMDNEGSFERYEGSIYKCFAGQLVIILSMLEDLEKELDL